MRKENRERSKSRGQTSLYYALQGGGKYRKAGLNEKDHAEEGNTFISVCLLVPRLLVYYEYKQKTTSDCTKRKS